MRLALAIVSLAFVLVTLAAATFIPQSEEPAGAPEITRAAETVWISGICGRDEGGWGSGAEAQCRVALANLEAALRAEGGSLEDVVELTTYHRNPDSVDAFRQLEAEVFGPAGPAWTAVEVSELTDEDSLVEIKATAVLGGRP